MEEKSKTSFLRSVQLKAKIGRVKQKSKEISEIKEEILSYANQGFKKYARKKPITPAMLEYLVEEGFKVRPMIDKEFNTYAVITWLEDEKEGDEE